MNVQTSDKEQTKKTTQNTYEKRGSWLATLKASWRAVLRFDRSQFTPFQAIRSTVAFALPLALGLATGQVTGGLVIASGALMLGSVGLRDPYRTRVRAMLIASLFVAISTLVGGIAGSNGWLLVLVTGLWGVAAGLFSSVSQVALVTGLQACAALIIYAHFAQTPAQALKIAALILAGALFQTLLAIIPSPWANTDPERTVLAAIYRNLARYAASPSGGQDVLQLSETLLQGHTTLLHSNTRTEKGKMFARLLEEADRLRLTLNVLISSYQNLTGGQAEEERSAATYLARMIRASADELQAIAAALKPSHQVIEYPAQEPYEVIKQSLAELRKLAQTSGNERIQRTLPFCTALLAELRIAIKLAVSWRYARHYWPVRIRFPYPRPPRLHLEDAWSSMRANLNLQSSAFRHALRLGVALALATALYEIFHLPVERGYWIPLTVVLVLRSDFITTYTRGIARLLGTTLGAVLTTLLIVFLAPSQPVLVAIVIIAAYLMYSTVFANYAIFSAAVTMAAVFLISFTVPPTAMTAAYRAIDTIIGGALALLIYALWPTWEESQVPANIAKRLETLGHYVNAVMQLYTGQGEQQTQELERRHMESRLARSNALGSVARSLQEPEPHRFDAELAGGLLEAADNIARHGLALEAYLHDNPRRYALPEIAAFGEQVDHAMSRLAAALREGRHAPELPDLAEALRALQAAAGANKRTPDDARTQWHFLIVEAKRIVTNIEAMQQLLSTGSIPGNSRSG